MGKEINFDYLNLECERDFNLLYLEINPTIRTGITKNKKNINSGIISNLAIYEVENDKLSYFFEEGSLNNIKYYIYETSYHEESQKINFNNEKYGLIINNNKIEKRKLADKLFIVNEKPGGNEYELWISSKLGQDKKRVNTFPKGLEWKIDVYNQKIFFIYKKENGVKIESIHW